MILLLDFALPFTDPVLIFSVVLFIIFFAPIILRKLRIPGLIGLILAGVIVGPNGFNLLMRSSGIILFGTVGLLYIMFLAGLEVDMNDFKKNKNRSLVFGAFTFFIPLVVGSIVSIYVIGLSVQAALLLASMFATHTLISYPIASKLGIAKDEAVTISIGGTIITDTAVLILLAVITGSVEGNLSSDFWIRLAISLTLFTIVVFWGFAAITRWFFRNIQEDGGSQYIFVLSIVFASAFLAELAGVEAIIGAFLAGLSLNRLIPHTSPLMNRIEFIGNNLFIPFFLINVGMIVDLKVLFKGYDALMVAGVLTAVALSTKWVAAYFTQKVFRYTKIQRQLIFGLSSSHAAATLAVILVGYDLQLFDESILNGTIVLILITCLVSSFATENAGRKLAILESDKKPEISEIPERILVNIANPVNIEQKVDLAIMLKDEASDQPIYTLSVVKDDKDAKEQVLMANKTLEKALKRAAQTDTRVSIESRIDLNIANGITRAVKELLITEIIIGWHGQSTPKDFIFGTVLDSLLEKTEQMVLVTKIIHPLNTIKRIIVVVPPNAEFEVGISRWVKTIRTLSKQAGANVIFYGEPATLEKVKYLLNATKSSIEAEFKKFRHWDNLSVLTKVASKTDDLLIIVSARSGTVSYQTMLDVIPKTLSRHFKDYSFIVIYPEQYAIDPENKNLQLDGMTITPIEEDIQRINKIGKGIKRLLKRFLRF
ncbi:MAG TPA: cation:proton antiporter [Cytophagaceae bacterium]